MIKSILGKKVGMTQVYTDTGVMERVTAIEAGPCMVLQVKKPEGDKYNALQLGFDEKREKSTNKPMAGHFKKANSTPKKIIREIKWDGKDEIKQGDKVTLDIFEKTNFVDITGITKGRGFAGGVKRWGFHGGPATHGQSDRERAPGSLGRQHSISQGVYPGKKMAGHYGVEKVTIRNLRIVKILKDKNIVLVRGGIPGPNGGYVILKESPKQRLPQIQTKKEKGHAVKGIAKK